MFGATLLCGHMPLLVNFTPSRLAQAQHLGRGLLLGAGLAIVIPEGVETVYDNAPNGGEGQSQPIAMALLTGFIFM